MHSRTQAPAPRPLPVSEHTGLAHDAGNLLGALQLYCGLLGSPGVLRSEHSHYAKELSLISSRSSALIQRLLQQMPELPALPGQPQSTTETSADPADVLREIAPVLHRIAAGCTLTVNAPPTLPDLDLPAESLERIAVNLVRNASEAMRQRSQNIAEISPAPIAAPCIDVSLTVVAGRAQLTVQDNGPGMNPDVAAAFLRPAPLPQGAVRGLGHLIIHELATASGGVLSIRVRPGRGTLFCIKWPLRRDSFASNQTPEAVRTNLLLEAGIEAQIAC